MKGADGPSAPFIAVLQSPYPAFRNSGMQLAKAPVALLLLCLGGCLHGVAASSQAADCPARPPLGTPGDLQDGFAGTTGLIWTIKPDCSYEVARFRGNEVSPPYVRGQLTPEQQSQLAAALSTAAVDTLPPAHRRAPACQFPPNLDRL